MRCRVAHSSRLNSRPRLTAVGMKIGTRLIVSLAIYEFLLLIRGTRAVQMALGSGLIVALFYLIP